MQLSWAVMSGGYDKGLFVSCRVNSPLANFANTAATMLKPSSHLNPEFLRLRVIHKGTQI